MNSLSKCLLKHAKDLQDFDTNEVKDAARVYVSRGKAEDEANILAIEDHLRDLEGQRTEIVNSALAEFKRKDPKRYAEIEAANAKAAIPTPAPGSIDEAAHEAATSPLNDTPQPTDGQKEAGNYKVGKVRVQGMDISIENPRGSTRSGVSPDGKAWQNVLQHHYGYIRGTMGRDKDHLDIFLTDGAETAKTAWVIDQKNKDGSFDEHKVVLGPETEAAARAAYLANYDAGWQGLGAITSMPIEAFKAWALDGKRKMNPLAYVVKTSAPDGFMEVGAGNLKHGFRMFVKEKPAHGERSVVIEFNGGNRVRGTYGDRGDGYLAFFLNDQNPKNAGEIPAHLFTPEGAAPAESKAGDGQQWDFESTFPPVPTAVKKALIREGREFPETDELNEASQRELINELVGIASDIDIAKDAHARGVSPATGRPMNADKLKALMDSIDRDQQQFDDLIASYEDLYGQEATNALSAHVMKVAKEGLAQEESSPAKPAGKVAIPQPPSPAGKEWKDYLAELDAFIEAWPDFGPQYPRPNAHGVFVGDPTVSYDFPATKSDKIKVSIELYEVGPDMWANRHSYDVSTGDAAGGRSPASVTDVSYGKAAALAKSVDSLRPPFDLKRNNGSDSQRKSAEKVLKWLDSLVSAPADANTTGELTDSATVDAENPGVKLLTEKLLGTTPKQYPEDDGTTTTMYTWRGKFPRAEFDAFVGVANKHDGKMGLKYSALLEDTPTSSKSIVLSANFTPTSKVVDVMAQMEVATKAASPRRGEVGMMMSSGEVVLTSSGRKTSPFPEIKSGPRNTGKTLEAVDRWLMQNALDEARSRGDEFNARQFEQNLAKPSKADKDSAEEYLFGEQPDVQKPFLKPIVADEKHENATAPEHINDQTGVTVAELKQIAKAFRDAIDSGADADVTHVFDAPAKGEIVNLEKKAGVTTKNVDGKRVYYREAGWMTPAEAKAKVQEWRARAAEQYGNYDQRSANSRRIVLSLFDLSGKWSQPWEEAGYQVFRFDIQNGDQAEHNGEVINIGDINNFSVDFFNDIFGGFSNDIYAILSANPCTDFAVSGARHFAVKDADGRTVSSVKLAQKTLATIEYFKPPVWALENPVGRIEELTGLPPWRLAFDPYQLGDNYTKKTLIWGRFNADLPIAPAEPTEGSKMHSQYGGKSQATKDARSETPEGFAYGFFMANNAIDNPVLAIAGKYDRLDRGLIAKAVAKGITEEQIDNAVEDFYYQDLDDAAANEAIADLISEAQLQDPSQLSPLQKGTETKGLPAEHQRWRTTLDYGSREGVVLGYTVEDKVRFRDDNGEVIDLPPHGLLPVQQNQATEANNKPFDSEAWDKERAERIERSKEAGQIHLDQVTPSVETMRGKTIFYVHDRRQKGVIRTVDNNGNVYVDWADKHSADKELASETIEDNKAWLKESKDLPYMRQVRDGKTYVFRSSLGPSDLKDYHFASSKLDSEKQPVAPVAESLAPAPSEPGEAGVATGQGGAAAESRADTTWLHDEIVHLIEQKGRTKDRKDLNKVVELLKARMGGDDVRAGRIKSYAIRFKSEPKILEVMDRVIARLEAEDKAAANAKRQATRAEKADPLAKVREFYTPGNIIHSDYWKQYDKVLEFKAGDLPGQWNVKVIQVVKNADGEWVPKDARMEPARWHSTAPDAKDKIVDSVKPAQDQATAEPAAAERPEATTSAAAGQADGAFAKRTRRTVPKPGTFASPEQEFERFRLIQKIVDQEGTVRRTHSATGKRDEERVLAKLNDDLRFIPTGVLSDDFMRSIAGLFASRSFNSYGDLFGYGATKQAVEGADFLVQSVVDGTYTLDEARAKNIGFIEGKPSITNAYIEREVARRKSPPTTETSNGTQAAQAQQTQEEEPPAPAAAAVDGDSIVEVKDVYGVTHRVKKKDLDGTRDLIKTFTKDGKPKEWLNRGNIDLTGEAQAKMRAEVASNPLFDVITADNDIPFKTEAAAKAFATKNGYTETHVAVAADTVQDGLSGFVLKKKASEPEIGAKKQLSKAAELLGSYTGGRFDIDMLAGPQKGSVRAHVMAALLGVDKVPQSKAGITAIRDELYRQAGITGETIRDRELAFDAWVKGSSGNLSIPTKEAPPAAVVAKPDADEERFERAMRAAATADQGAENDIQTTALRYVPFDTAMTIAREAVMAGVRPVPGQFHTRLDLTMDSAMRLLAEINNQKPKASVDDELQNALSHLGDVLGEVFGGQMNITGPQYSAKDLLPAISKVIELLVKKGFLSFKQAVGETVKLLRGNAKTEPFVNSISPRQFRAAYNSVAEFHAGTDSEDVVGAISDAEIQAIISPPAPVEEDKRNSGRLEESSPETIAAANIDFKGFRKSDRAGGDFILTDGNFMVKVESTTFGKYQASVGSAKSTPHLDGLQGAIDWAAAYREEAKRTAKKIVGNPSKLPNETPANYATLEKLLEATERAASSGDGRKMAGQSRAIWLHNAEFVAESKFGAGEQVRAIVSRYSVTRAQDLKAETGGHAVFGIPLPTRSYSVGDNIPGLGEVKDAVRLEDGYQQFLVGGEWYHETVVDQKASPIEGKNVPSESAKSELDQKFDEIARMAAIAEKKGADGNPITADLVRQKYDEAVANPAIGQAEADKMLDKTLKDKTDEAKDHVGILAEFAWRVKFEATTPASDATVRAAIKNGSFDISGQPWAAAYFELFSLDPATIEKSAAAEGVDEDVAEQLAKFRAGVFNLPGNVAANVAALSPEDKKAAKKAASAANAARTRAYTKAARLFLEGPLDAKIPTGKAAGLNVEFLENVALKPIERGVKRVKTYADQMKALSAASADGDIRYYLNGIHIEAKNKRMVATDGHRMAVLEEADMSGVPPMVEGRTVLNRYFGKDEKAEQWHDGRFPDWSRVVRDKHAKNKGEFNAKRVGDYARAVAKAWRYTGLKWSPISIKIGDAVTHVNVNYLVDAADMFRAFGYDSFVLSFDGENDSLLLTPLGGGNLTQVIMPMRSGSEARIFRPLVPETDVRKQREETVTVDEPVIAEPDEFERRGIDLENRNVDPASVKKAVDLARKGDDALLRDLERIAGGAGAEAQEYRDISENDAQEYMNSIKAYARPALNGGSAADIASTEEAIRKLAEGATAEPTFGEAQGNRKAVKDFAEETLRQIAVANHSFKDIDRLNAATNPLGEDDWVRLADGSEWQVKGRMKGWALVRDGMEHVVVKDIMGQVPFIRAVIEANEAAKAPAPVKKKAGQVTQEEASSVIKDLYSKAAWNKWTWSRLKARLKTAFEELYISHSTLDSALEKAMTEYARNANGRLGYPNANSVYAAMKSYGLIAEPAPTTALEAEAAIQDGNATREATQFLKDERDAEQRAQAAGAWRQKYLGNDAESIAAGDIARSDYEKLGQMVDTGRIATNRAFDMIDDAVASGVLDAKVGEYMKSKVVPSGFKKVTEYFRDGKPTAGYAPFAEGERVRLKANGMAGAVESFVGEGPQFPAAIVKFDNGSTIRVSWNEVEAAQEKEPWQMTKAEFRDNDQELLAAKGLRDKAQDAVGSGKGTSWGNSVRYSGAMAGNRLEAADKAREKWSRAFDKAEAKHKAAVEKAIADGRDVPAEVLADYPDLQASKPPEWHTAIPAEGLPIQDGDNSINGPARVVGRVAADAYSALTQNQLMNGMAFYAHVKPAANGRHGIVRLLPDDQNAPEGWQLLNGEAIRPSMMSVEQMTTKLSGWLRSAPIIGEAVKESKPAENTRLNMRPTVATADILTSAGAIKSDARSGANRIWYHQGDPNHIQFAAKVTFGGQPAPAEDVERWERLKKAQEVGYRLVNRRAGSLGTVWTLEKDGETLTADGYNAINNPVFEKPVRETSGPGYDNMVSGQATYATKLAEWFATLPESTLRSASALAAKINLTPIGEWAKITRDRNGDVRMDFSAADGKLDLHMFTRGEASAYLDQVRQIVTLAGEARAKGDREWFNVVADAEKKADAAREADTDVRQLLTEYGFIKEQAAPDGFADTPIAVLRGKRKSFWLADLDKNGGLYPVKLNYKQTTRGDWYFDIYRTNGTVSNSIPFPAVQNSTTARQAADILLAYVQTDNAEKDQWGIKNLGVKYGAAAGVQPGAESPVTAHYELMERLRNGEATLAEYKAGYDSLQANEEAIKAELEAKTKDELLRLGGSQFAYQYKNDAKARVIEGLYRDMASDFSLHRSISYVMSSGGYEAAVARMVEGTSEETLQEYADKVKASIEENAARRAEIAAGIADPKTIEDFENYLRLKKAEGMTFKQARLSMSPEKRAQYDLMKAELTRNARAESAEQRATDIAVTATNSTGKIVENRHTKTGEQLYTVQIDTRVDNATYSQWKATAKKLDGYYSSFKGNGAVPGWIFKTPDNAQAFLTYVGGDATQAQEAAKEERDSFKDDRTQTAAERLNEMADRLEERADEELGRERMTNTARRARMAAAAEAGAESAKALAKTMRNIAAALTDGTAKFLDRVRQKAQVEMLRGIVHRAKYDELRTRYPSYADQEKHQGEPPTIETADYADFPAYTTYRSNLANLARQMVEIDGMKKTGAALLKIADDVTDAYLEFAKKNLHLVSRFSKQGGEPAVFPSKDSAETAIKRSGHKGRAIVLPFKRGQNMIILSPSAAREMGIWSGDDDKRITLPYELGDELAEIGQRNPKLGVPHYIMSVAVDLKRLRALGIQNAPEYRAMLREFIGLNEAAKKPDRIKELERAMVGRAKDGLDFFPTPAETAQAMIEAAELEEGMAILEPSAGMGHIADQIRDAGFEPDVVELSTDRRELLDAKGYHLAGSDFMEMTPRGFTYGDVFRAPDGSLGVMRGSGGMGSGRVGFHPLDADGQYDKRVMKWMDRDDLEGVEKRGLESGYDRIIMNPPFGDRRDAEHVRHAFDLLRPGGRLVALMGEGVFFGQDKKAEEFRDWLQSVGGTSEKLAEGTFLDKSLPVTTGVNARMVVIDKPKSSVSFNASTAPVGQAIDAAGLNEVIDAVLLGSPSHWSRDTVVAVERFADLPAAIQEDARAEGYDEQGRKDGQKLPGATYDGKVYLVQENISGELEAEETLLHERIHQVLNGSAEDPNGIALRQMLGRLYMMLGGRAGIERMAAEGRFNVDGPLQAAEGVPERNRAAFLAEEFLAHAEGARAYESFLQKVLRAIREFWGEFRDWLRSSRFVRIAEAVGVDLGDFTRADLAWTLKGVREAAPATGSKAVRFMRKVAAEPIVDVKQSISSANTSRKITPSSIGWGDRAGLWVEGATNFDMGAGKYGDMTEPLAERGVTNYEYDPFWLSAKDNKRAIDAVMAVGADTVTVNNILNVIKEPEARRQVIRQAAKAVANDGTAVFVIYEGDKTGKGKETRDGYQVNAKAADYVGAIGEFFGDVKRDAHIIVAREPNKAITKGRWSPAEDQPMFSRGDYSEIVGKAKDLGLPATGKRDYLENLVRIAESDPRTWSQDDLSAIAPYLSIHQDLREGSESRVASIMENGLDRGMVDSLEGMVSGKSWTWAGGLKDGDAYVFMSRNLKYKSSTSPYLAPGNVPLFHIRTQRGQSVLDALKTATSARQTSEYGPVDTNSPEFKAWFDGSAVIDADGNPLRLYHATPADVSTFKPGGNTPKLSGVAIWATPKATEQPAAHNTRVVTGAPNRVYGNQSGKFSDGTNVMPLYASIKNPLVSNDKNWKDVYKDFNGGSPWILYEDAVDAIRAAGFDGVMHYKNGVLEEVAVFRPEQIKSAVSNTGAFDPNDGNILHSNSPAAGATGSTPDDIRAALVKAFGGKSIRQLEDNGVLTILDSAEEFGVLFPSVRVGPTAKAVFIGDRAYFFANRMQPATAHRELLHEIGEHYGLEKMLGVDGYDALIQRVKKLRDDGDEHAARAWDFVVRNYPEETEGSRRFMHEVLAQLGQNADIQARPWWKQIIEAVKRFLVRIGFTGMIKVSDIQDMVLHSLKVAAKPDGRGPGGGMRADEVPAMASARPPFSPVDTSSPEFKAWFGDSKVVDADGEPLVVYHGTDELWTVMQNREDRLAIFDKNARGAPADIVRQHREYLERGAGAVWMSDDEGVAYGYADGGDVMPVYVSLQNPLDLRPDVIDIDVIQKILTDAGLGTASDNYGWEKGIAHAIVWDNTRLIDYARKNGYDGLIYPDTDINGRYTHVSYVALSPGQIKSAVSNTGEFDPANPDIRYSQRGPWYYSALAATIPGMAKIADKAGMVSPEAAKAWLAARQKEGKFKADEYSWSGLGEWLDMKASETVFEPGFGVVEEYRNEDGSWQQVDDFGHYYRTKPEADRRMGEIMPYPAELGIESRRRVKEFPEVDLGKRGVKVAVADIERFVRENGVQVQEVVLGERSGKLRKVIYGSDVPGERGVLNSEEEASEWARADRGARSYYPEPAENPKFARYQLPGGENYRELLLTLPSIDVMEVPVSLEWEQQTDNLLAAKLPNGNLIKILFSEDGTIAELQVLEPDAVDIGEPQQFGSVEEAKAAAVGMAVQKRQNVVGGFISPHFQETPNILAHVRYNERTDANGGRILFLEELQGDWPQAYRKQRVAINRAVDNDFVGIVKRMEADGVLEVNCD